MKKSNKILLGIVLALVFLIACETAGFLKASQHKSATEKVTKTTKQVSKTDKRVKQPADNKQTQSSNDNNFSNTPWTSQSALDFLQKVNDASSEGAKVVNETNLKYIGEAAGNKIPGNSIYILQQGRGGAGSGGVVLTKNKDHTVTLIVGMGAESWPYEKVVVDAKDYKVLSQSKISNEDHRQNMFQYFGVKSPKAVQEDDSDNSNDNDDNSSDSNKDSDDNKSDHNDDKSSDDNSSDSNDDNSQSSDANKKDDNSDND